MTLVAFWFLVLTVLWVGFLVLEGFDFGVGMLHGVVGRDEPGRRTAIATIAPVWDANEVWLIVATAGTFAAFPGWYATMLSGFYPVFLVVVLALILRGVAFEFRSHAGTDRSRRGWSAALTAGSLVIPLGLGIVLGGLLGGVPIDSDQEFTGGLGDLLAPYALATGVTLTLLCLLHGAVYLSLRTEGAALHARARAVARALGPVTALVVLVWCSWTRAVAGNAVLLSFIELTAVLAAMSAAVLVRGGREGAAFAATSVTVVAVVVSIFTELYPRVMVSSLGAANDLTAESTASASYSLTVMTVTLAVLLPVVLAYQAWSFHVFRGRLRGPRADPGGPGPTVPAPRRTQATAGAPSSGVGEVAGPRAGGRPVLRIATGAVTLVVGWLLLRLVPSGRATH